MRLVSMSVVSLLVLVCITGELAEHGVAQLRTPTTESGQPGNWPQQSAKRRVVDVTELKAQANELITVSQTLPEQMEQLGNGTYPKELVNNLKKIEKLAKHIRGEIE